MKHVPTCRGCREALKDGINVYPNFLRNHIYVCTTCHDAAATALRAKRGVEPPAPEVTPDPAVEEEPTRPTPGMVYLLHNPAMDAIKVGRALDVQARLAGHNASIPRPEYRWTLVSCASVPDYVQAERELLYETGLLVPRLGADRSEFFGAETADVRRVAGVFGIVVEQQGGVLR